MRVVTYVDDARHPTRKHVVVYLPKGYKIALYAYSQRRWTMLRSWFALEYNTRAWCTHVVASDHEI